MEKWFINTRRWYIIRETISSSKSSLVFSRSGMEIPEMSSLVLLCHLVVFLTVHKSLTLFMLFLFYIRRYWLLISLWVKSDPFVRFVETFNINLTILWLFYSTFTYSLLTTRHTNFMSLPSSLTMFRFRSPSQSVLICSWQ